MGTTLRQHRESVRRDQNKSGHYATRISESDLFTKKLKDPIAKDLVETRAFRRLKQISFLGAISYQKEYGAKALMSTETRYFHSLGVARIAEKFAEAQSLTIEDRRLIVAASLLHDIGHPPLSHSAEAAFQELFGENHHSMTERLILGREKIGRDIPQILTTHKIDPHDVLALLNGRVKVRGLDLFKGPFNLDTLEGISRCSTYMAGRVDISVPSPTLVLESAIDPFNTVNLGTLDCFWRLKNRIYNDLIRNPLGVAADKIANDYILENASKFDISILTSNDHELLTKHEKLFRRLHDFVRKDGDQTNRRLDYIKREFVVDESQSAKNLADRYKQTKTPTTFEY